MMEQFYLILTAKASSWDEGPRPGDKGRVVFLLFIRKPLPLLQLREDGEKAQQHPYAATSLPRRKPGKDEAQRSIRTFYEAVIDNRPWF